MRKARINVEIFKSRRHRLAQLMPNCAMVLPAWPEYIRNADSHHNYRVESNLFYLTGFEEPEACLVFRPGKNPETVMFVRTKNPERETWDGFRFGVDGARDVFQFDQTYAYSDFEKLAPELLRGMDRIYYTMFRNKEFDEIFGRVMITINGWRPRYGLGMAPIEDAYAAVGEMRIRKTEEEAEMMRQAGQISADGHIEMMKATKPGINERALHGIFLKTVMERGAMGEAYGGIVASGNNATTLHYRFNDETLQAGQLLLVDCGAEYNYYSGDITRTYPVSGRYSPVQKRVYEKILKAQKQLCSMVKPGEPFHNLQKFCVEAMTQILVEEGALQGSVEENIKSQAYAKYYMHGVSHLLGLDTHDAGVLHVRGESRPMEAGWCLTIEPGLYFPAGDTSLPQDLRGVGIRIEDDVLVTPEGQEVLTKGVPKDIEEIESLVGANYR